MIKDDESLDRDKMLTGIDKILGRAPYDEVVATEHTHESDGVNYSDMKDTFLMTLRCRSCGAFYTKEK